MSNVVDFEFKQYKPKRVLTSFQCQELLYDYITEKLDDERKELVIKTVASDHQIQSDLRAIKNGIEYCDHLGGTRLSDILYDEMTFKSHAWPKWIRFLSIKKWPVSVRWGSEALLASVLIGTVISMIPWNRWLNSFRSHTTNVLIEELAKDKKKMSSNEEEIPLKGIEFAALDAQLKKDLPESEPKNSDVRELTKDEKKGSPQEDQLKKESVSTTNGYVYMGTTMVIKNLEGVASEIISSLEQLGAIKGGNVSIGWKKPEGRYFHFIIDEKNYNAMLKIFRKYGPLQVTKISHERVMEKNKMRFIVTLQDKGLEPLPVDSNEDMDETSPLRVGPESEIHEPEQPTQIPNDETKIKDRSPESQLSEE